jgi:AcrR family transcriptional regulator
MTQVSRRLWSVSAAPSLLLTHQRDAPEERHLTKAASSAIMHVMHDSPEMGLRERKKLETRNAIERAAVKIALEQGYEAATAEAIARRADVSLRTFFNYFATKDVAIVGPDIRVIDEPQAIRILEKEGAHVLKGISRVIEACVAAMSPASDILQDRRRLVQLEPRLLHAHMTALMEFETGLTKVIASFLRLHPERRRLAGLASVDDEASMMVAMIDSAIRYSMERWPPSGDVQTFARDIERTIDMMAEIYRRDW